MVGIAALIAAVLILSYLGVHVIRFFAERHQILDIPNERSSHTESVPRGGGLAIVLLTLGAVWLFSGSQPLINRWSLLAYTIGATLIVAISWVDDLYSQPSWLRFSIHSIGAALAIYGFGYFQVISITNSNPALARWLGVTITFVWIVGLTNAFNFMDGIDGIAGSQAVVAGLCWAAVGWWNRQPLMIVMGSLLAASSLGFLFHNWFPARIFMGDVGSAFLGYSFAVLPLIFASDSSGARGLSSLLAGVLPLWPFVFDSTFTFLRRLAFGENVFQAHRSHLYQRLVIVGYSHRFVSLLYAGLAILGVVMMLGWIEWFRNIATVAVMLPLSCVTLWGFVIRQEHRRAGRLREQAT